MDYVVSILNAANRQIVKHYVRDEDGNRLHGDMARSTEMLLEAR